MDRTMVSALRTDVAPRLVALQTKAEKMAAKDVVNELHKLRGAIASFGFSACAHELETLEHGWQQLSPADHVVALKVAHERFLAGLNALVSRFPHLGEE
jgi:hypothetical protein